MGKWKDTGLFLIPFGVFTLLAFSVIGFCSWLHPSLDSSELHADVELIQTRVLSAWLADPELTNEVGQSIIDDMDDELHYGWWEFGYAKEPLSFYLSIGDYESWGWSYGGVFFTEWCEADHLTAAEKSSGEKALAALIKHYLKADGFPADLAKSELNGWNYLQPKVEPWMMEAADRGKGTELLPFAGALWPEGRAHPEGGPYITLHRWSDFLDT